MKKNILEISLAIPDSILEESQTLLDKTIKTGQIARTCSIFGVEKIYIYNDQKGKYENDREILKKILFYAETPQYLRKKIFGNIKELQYVGTLPPLQTPHHKQINDYSELRSGEIREGIIEKINGKLYVDIGLTKMVKLIGNGRDMERISCKIKVSNKEILAERINKELIENYWGYSIKIAPSLGKLVNSLKSDLVILTSRYGNYVKEIENKLKPELVKNKKILIVFGSPQRGLEEILMEEKIKPEDISEFYINMINNQKTKTVRAEEAILITLSLINSLINDNS